VISFRQPSAERSFIDLLIKVLQAADLQGHLFQPAFQSLHECSGERADRQKQKQGEIIGKNAEGKLAAALPELTEQ
jgi:hypothetical protein